MATNGVSAVNTSRMTTPNWSGVFPAITTQMFRDGSLDLEATGRHLEALIVSGVSGMVMLGSLGENQAMSGEEKRRVMEFAVKVVGGRIPVLSGVAETSTGEAARYVRDGEALGIDGYMLMPAMVYRPADARETLEHFRTVAAATGLPIMVYNNPISYGNDITPEMFAALESAVLGIDGWVAGTGIAFPEENQCLWDLMKAGRWVEAVEIYRWFSPLLHLDVHGKFVQYIKLAVQECGLGAEWTRAPRLPLIGEERKAVLGVIHKGIENRPQLPKVAQGKK